MYQCVQLLKKIYLHIRFLCHNLQRSVIVYIIVFDSNTFENGTAIIYLFLVVVLHCKVNIILSLLSSNLYTAGEKQSTYIARVRQLRFVCCG